MKDAISIRMKEFYEKRTQTHLPRRTYTVIRLDGNTFHTYTKGCKIPFDDKLMEDMDKTAAFLCSKIQGSKFAFVQSDEISILVTDFDNLKTDAWFDNNVQKMTSISASYATAKFNELRPGKLAFFDSRVFTIPSPTEVMNYFIWRQQDTVRNSISSVAQSLYSHKALEFKNTNMMQDLIFDKGINWNDYDARYKRGRIILKREGYPLPVDTPKRSSWVMDEPPIFSQDREYLNKLIPLDL